MQKRSLNISEKRSKEEIIREINIFLQELGKHISIEEVYLFGSYVKDTWLKTSDIDLVIISSDFKNMRYLERLELIYSVQWRLNLKHFIEVIPLTPEEFRKRKKKSIVLRDASKYWIKIK